MPQPDLFEDPPPRDPIVRDRLSRDAQAELMADLARIIAIAPLYRPVMPRTGAPFSVQMTNCGPLGWVADRTGYRYQPVHPVTGLRWPPMPPQLIELWHRLTDLADPPEAGLINYYAPGARMGLHQDRDEQATRAPVLSVSLGDSALFRLGGGRRTDPASRHWLHSGDVMLLQGETRLAFHGIDRLAPDATGFLLPFGPDFARGGRINVTLRRVSPLQMDLRSSDF